MCNYNLFRGFKNSFLHGEYKNKYLDKPRRPLHTPIDIHLRADAWFFSNFGYKFRSQSLFCYGTISAASHYGKVGIVNPVGEHKLCWSPIINDLYFKYKLYSTELTLEQLLESGSYEVFTFEDTELMQHAITSGHEIMLWCKAFKIIDPIDLKESPIKTATGSDIIII